MTKSLVRFIGGLFLIAATIGSGATIGIGALSAGPAGAVPPTFTVNDASDAGLAAPGTETTCTSTNVVAETNTCTLRAAIEASNNMQAPTTIAPPDPTTLTPPLTAYTLADGTLGQLQIDDLNAGVGQLVTIDGAGANLVTIEAAATADTATTRVLKVDPNVAAAISGVTIANGVSSNSGEVGGGILNCATLTLSDSTVTNNETNAGPGGGIYAETAATTNLDGDTVTGNTGDNGGGIYAEGGTMTLDDTQVNDNTANGGEGGGIFVEGQSAAATGFTADDGSQVSGNTAADGGGGIAIGGSDNLSTVVDIDSSTISNNTVGADEPGGGIDQFVESTLTVSNSTISGNAPTEAGSNDGGGAFLDGTGSVDTFTTDTIDGNNQAEDGAGVYVGSIDPTFSGGTISGNTASANGGGVFINSGTTTFTDESINANTATDSGGGVYIEGGTNTFAGGSVSNNGLSNEGDGGGIEVTGGTNTFSGQTVSDNTAFVGGGFSYGGFGDSITNETISGNSATYGASAVYVSTSGLSITASTISGNTTPGVGGGGIVNNGCNVLTLTNDTIADNTDTSTSVPSGGGYLGVNCGETHLPAVASSSIGSSSWTRVGGVRPQVTATEGTFLFDTFDGNTSAASGAGGNIEQADSSVISLAETIVAGGTSGGTAANCFVGNPSTFTSGGYNLIDDSTCGTPAATDIIGKSAQLGSLGNNGGPTQTEVPGNGSPAISAIPAAVCSGTGVSTDQRGNARGAGTNGSCTIGAVEVAVSAPPSFNPNGYRMVADEGGIFDFGLDFNGSLANNKLNAPIVGIANSPGPNGYLMVGSDGGVFALGGANFYGSLCCNPLPSPIAAIAATPSEDGYWLASQAGTITNFGNTPALPAVQVPAGARIVGMASTNDGKGLWLTDNLGDVYAVGDALYLGGMGGIRLNAPVVGIAAAANGQGYVLAASDGGTFNFGVGFFGSVPGSLAPGQHLVAPIVGIAVTHSGKGYWMVGADGGLFNYGDAPFLGSIYTAIDGTPLNGPIVGIQHLGSAPPI